MIPYSSHNWFFFMTICAFVCAFIMCLRSRKQMLRGNKYPILGIILLILSWWYTGVRPINKEGDSALYSTIYNLVLRHEWTDIKGFESEGFWATVEYACLNARMSASQWFQVIAGFYFFGFGVAIWKWMRRNFTSAFIFTISAMSFWAYATNGLRSGMAAALGTAGLAFFTNAKNPKDILSIAIAVTLMFLSSITHNSMWLFFAASLAAWLLPSKKMPYYVWGVCLLLSPLSGSLIMELGEELISDMRLAYYQDADMTIFSRNGWRWDFILYSTIPVVWSWYIINKRKLADKRYIIITEVYVLCNAAWLLVNSVPFSNRFAYISWCIYPFVMCYPLFKMRISKYQGLIGGAMLAFFTIFTLLLA